RNRRRRASPCTSGSRRCDRQARGAPRAAPRCSRQWRCRTLSRQGSLMWLVHFALRRPLTIIVFAIAIVFAAIMSVRKAPADIFPSLGVPVVYVVQPYGGMSPTQMEGQLVGYYEYHFLYINGIEHIESQSIQGMAMLKLYFHSGTDIAQSL